MAGTSDVFRSGPATGSKNRVQGSGARDQGRLEVMALSDHSDSLARYVLDFPRCRVLVVGDAILDEYLLGDCSRISPEAPVPVLKVHSDKQELGGAANTAAN